MFKDTYINVWIGRQISVFIDRCMDRQIDGRQIDGQTNRWIDKQMDRQIDGQTNRWIDKQVNR